ncbi:MAG: preprotein translocase subunit SecY [Bacteroidales bacterium]|nr:preprotein translocase subunit SecY [Bacteroidales bacterium]
MKKLIQTIKNIYKIEELRKRIGYTLLLLIVYRLGSFVVLPGIDANAIAGSALASNSQEGLMGLLNMFSGGAFANASIFALGVMPYISASIVIQLLGIFVPYFRRLQMEGESGRRKMNQYTRYLTIVIVLIQGFAYMKALPTQLPAEVFVYGSAMSTAVFNLVSVALLLGGTMFVMWLGERITDRGIGNGISLIIMIGIIARLPWAFLGEIDMKFAGTGGGPIALIVELVVLFFVFVAAIAIVQAVRKVPVQYAKRVIGNKQYGGVRQYIPMKINAAGVMPIIFAQALMMIPMLFPGTDFAAAMRYTGFWYNFTFALLVIVFTYFYTAVTINPTMMAEEMRKNNGFIPGVKPGRKTAEFLDSIMSRVTLPGSIFLALIAILPVFAQLLGVEPQFASFYGGTSLLILVGVVLDTLQQIESHLLMRHYDGLMKTGRLKGRSGM